MNIVEVVEKDEVVSTDPNIGDFDYVPTDEQAKPTTFVKTSRYNLDIIDELHCTDGTYLPFNYGLGSDIYILDTGINYDHGDFRWRGGRSGTRALYGGYDAVDEATGTNLRGRDCHGHGTHVAGVAGGLYSGVAKEANLYSIRVLDCCGSGMNSWVMEGIIAVYNQSLRSKLNGSIINMSLGSKKCAAVNKAVNKAVEKGITVVTASGNDAMNACNYSPGSADLSINVGAHGYVTSTCKKPIADFSNYGPCVDIIAPGIDIPSADYQNNADFTKKSGTSMACPHVSGVVALMKSARKDFTPSVIKNRITVFGVDDIDRSAMSAEVRAISKAKRLYISCKLIAKYLHYFFINR